MIDREVAREARDIAHDARSTRDFSDAEAEVLRDLLKGDEQFEHLVTAQQAAVRVDVEDTPHSQDIEHLAHEGATPLGEAIDDVINTQITRAREIVSLADALDEPWGGAMTLYQGGFETVEDLRAVGQHELVAESGCPPALAARTKATVGDVEEVEH